MPYNKALEDRIEEITLSWDRLKKKKMFGGICYLINGNMSFGIWKDYLIVRMKPELAVEKMSKNAHVRAFDITGKPMKGWVIVEAGALSKVDKLTEWLEIGKSFAKSLPDKTPKEKSLEDIYYKRQRKKKGRDRTIARERR